MSQKECVLVLGMHRSGTSLVGRLLYRLGYYGGNRLKKSSYDNEVGFFEDEDIVNINDELLQLLGFNWTNYNSPEPINFNSSMYKELKRRAQKNLIKSRSYPKIFIKDPRLCITLQFWLDILSESDYRVKLIFCLREPYSIFSSLHSRNLMTSDKAYWLTWMYWMNAVQHIGSLPYITLSYEVFIGDRQNIIDTISNFLQFESKDLLLILESVFEKRLAHHTTNAESDKNHPVFDLYNFLLSLSIDVINEAYMDSMKSKYYSDRDHITTLLSKRVAYIKVIFNENEAQIKNYTWINLNEKFTAKVEWLTTQSKMTLYISPGQKGMIQIDLCDLVNTSGHPIPFDLTSDSKKAMSNLLEVDDKGLWITITTNKTLINGNLLIGLNFHSTTSFIFRRFQQDFTESTGSFFLKSLLSSPFSVFTELNLHNINKFRRALRNESFSQVSRNAKKYILKKIDGRKELNAEHSQERLIDLYENRILNPINNHLPYSILFVVSEWPDEERSSGERRTLNILDILKEHAQVHLFCYELIDRVQESNLRERGFMVHQTFKSLKSLMRNSVQHLIISKYFNAKNTLKIRAYFNKANVILDSVDINWVKEEKALQLGIGGFKRSQVVKNKENELKAYSEVDQIWVVTHVDKEKLLEMGITTSIDIISNIHENDVQSYQHSEEKNLLFLGGFNYYANRESVIWIVNDILPKIKKRVSDIKLLIAGSNIDDEIRRLEINKGVEVIGYIPEEDLGELYRNVRLAFVPLIVGSGIKGKICEAIANAVPVVTNDIGNEGIGLVDMDSVILGNDVNSIVDKTIRLIDDSDKLERLSKRAKEQLVKIVSPGVVRKNLINSLFPKISIGVITWNGINLLKNCLNSILEHTVYPNYEVLVYSNGCNDGTQEYLRELMLENDNIVPILSNTNEVFVRPNNRLMMLAGKNDIVLLNNDIIVTPNWLCELQIAAYSDPRIGIAGSKLLYEDGTLQEYGCSINQNGNGINHGKGDDNPFRNDYSSINATGYVSGCSFYIKRSTIAKIGGFDDDFHPIYCEDSDYCYTAWENDIYTVVSGRSVLYHLEGATNGRDINVGLKRHQMKNYKQFMSKHKDAIRNIELKIKKVNKELSS